MPFADETNSELFRQLVDSAPDAMVVVDGSGVIVLVNVQAENIFGYPRNELLGRTIETLVSARFRAVHVGHRRAFMAAPRGRPRVHA